MSNEMIIIAIVNLIIIGAIVILMLRKRNIEKANGIPETDELSRQVMYKSGFYAFWISFVMWLILAFVSYETFRGIDSWEAYIPMFGFMGMGIVYIIVGLLFQKRGVP